MASNLRTWRRPWDSQPQGNVRLAERFSWPGAIAFTPSVGVLGGAANTRVDIITGGTPAGLGARAATTSGRIDLGPVTRIGTGGATWVMTLRRTGTSLRYAHGTLDDGSSYIEQIMVNSLAGEATSAGNVGLYYRTEAGLTRAAGTTSAPLALNQVHTVVFQITSPTTWAIFIDGAEQAVSYSGSATLTAQSGIADYSLFLCNRHNRATLTGGATDVDVVSFGRFPSNDIDIAAVSANPWLMFEPRRILVPVSAGGGGTTISVPAGSLALTGFAPIVSATANQTIAVPAGALTLAGFAPTVNVGANQTISVPAGSLTITGFAPTVNVGVNQNIAVPAGSLSLTGFAPTISTSANQSIAVPVGSLTLTGFAPTVVQTAHQTISVPLGTLVMAGYAPTVSASGSYTISVPLGALVLTGYAPVVNNSGASATVTVKLGSWIRYKILT